ncbi:hypothetical protein CF336_g4258 [Tilletia laevis]|uniref:Uncharacterized protein n=1 Tax=Tilletia caries TaxID=13290 RepID=A0A177V9L7_9BASI|nr:hypothetical protein CF336_g4258 [Tilletia laevis]KAE8193753.1 hypothetical protein CF335_g5508 [Tilletia laevis]KAE8260174.1 hypothetical protein A4X03_0g3890 [Tilletia caries]CAD7063283.1 unnamed protein product [Tilletia caries]
MYTNLTPRLRRLFTSSFFGATFFGAFLTVAATTALASSAAQGEGPLACPAQQRKKRDALEAGRRRLAMQQQEEEEEEELRGESALSHMDSRRVGERVRLTSKGGWIEIPELKPSR